MPPGPRRRRARGPSSRRRPLLGFPNAVHATAIPDVAKGYAGQVMFFAFAADHELTRDELRAHAIMLLVGDIGQRADWPPDELPRLEGAKTDDEWRIRVAIERLADSEQDRLDVWQELKTAALDLADDPTFQLLETAHTNLLRAGHELDADTIRQVRHIITLGGHTVTTHTVETSARVLKARGAFALLADVHSPTPTKPRIRSGAFADAIATRQRAGQPIPVRGIGGNPLGHIDPQTIQEVPGHGLFMKGVLHTERVEATDTLRSVRANRVRFKYTHDLSEIRLHPKASVDDTPPDTFSQ
jgi:hypothetical protein